MTSDLVLHGRVVFVITVNTPTHPDAVLGILSTKLEADTYCALYNDTRPIDQPAARYSPFQIGSLPRPWPGMHN